MSATVLELEIVTEGGARWFEFTWTGDAVEWREALDAIKASVPPEARQFDPETKRWKVREDYEAPLSRIFNNFDTFLDSVRSQLSLFPEEGA
jgi:hypothetical protein